MRFSQSLLLALPALAIAEEQIPLGDKLKGWFNKAASVVSSATPQIPSPLDAGAAKVADAIVSPLTLENWKNVLVPSPRAAVTEGGEEWMVFVTGGNKTCFGACANATKAWNYSVPQLAASKNAPHLAILDCEDNQILCNSWSVGCPSIYHMLLPHPLPDQSTPATTVRYIPLNRTTVVTKDITEIHTKQTYKNTQPYEGAFHPFDGWLQKYQLAVPLSYVTTGFAKMPSWVPMIAVSFLSRTFMNKRMRGPTAAEARAAQQQGGAAPAAGR